MSKTNSGGMAFPKPATFDPETRQCLDVSQGGMTLRDWFAGQALTGYLAMMSRPDMRPDKSKAGDIASAALRIADAMIEARSAAE